MLYLLRSTFEQKIDRLTAVNNLFSNFLNTITTVHDNTIICPFWLLAQFATATYFHTIKLYVLCTHRVLYLYSQMMFL